MAAINPAFALQNAGATHTAANDRMMLSGLGAGIRAATSLIGRGGVNPMAGGVMAVTQTGSPSMGVIVASGIVYIPGTEGSVQGTYAATNDANVTLSISAAHATLPRIDIVVAKVEDEFYSGVTNAWSLVVVTGTANVSPTVPTAPANSVTLGQVAVAANATSITNANITDKRPFFTASGGIIPCTSSTKPALNTISEGQGIYLTDTGDLQFKQSGAYATRSVNTTFTSYTPTWTSVTGTNPAIGNGVRTAKYTRIGNVGFVWINMIFGTTTTQGSSAWEFTLPPGWTADLLNGEWIGGGMARDNSAAVQKAIGFYLSADLQSFGGRIDDQNQLAANSPFTWATSDNLKFSLTLPLTA